jgi:copper resistance protein B
VLGFEGLAPIGLRSRALSSLDKGDSAPRVEGYYDQRLTQRLVLQPRVELNFAAQDVPENRIGAGLSNAELGLRLRYEITRKLAPYVVCPTTRKAARPPVTRATTGKIRQRRVLSLASESGSERSPRT